MNEDLREKLRRLGLQRGLPTARSKPGPPAWRKALDGREVETPYGPAYVIEQHFDLNYRHGSQSLVGALNLPGQVLAQLAYETTGQPVDPAQAAFIDTETTGLAGGTGTLVFLVGVGRWHSASGAFHLSQFFLRQPGEEAAMLTALEPVLNDCRAVVTFNGRGFDMPLLQARFTLHRRGPAILTAPHLDLLWPARRIWRERLASCALSSLEEHILGVRRDQADVPGYLIPQMYFDYLQSGDASEMPRVVYHNAQDVLSLVTLLARLGRILLDPLTDPALDPTDLVSLARWYTDLGLSDRAEAVFRAALERPLSPVDQVTAWRRLGFLLKRQERYEEAARAWEQLAALDADIIAHVELAKYYEWHQHEPATALRWTEAALRQVGTWSPGAAREQAYDALMHRKQRLQRKQT